MTRIVGVPEKDAGLLGRFVYGFSRHRFGKVPEPVRVTAHHPKVLLGMGAMELALDRSALVDARLKKLAEMKVALAVGCEFCVDIGSMLGKGLGITDDQLRALPRFRESAVFSSVEKLVLEYAAEMTRTPAVIPEHLFGTLREYFDEAQMVELTAAIAWENHRARFNHALLAELASENGRHVALILGVYEMNEGNTPGVGTVLERHGLPCVPEAHCYLAHEGARVDLTREGGDAEQINDFLHEEEIEPRQIGEYKVRVHRGGSYAVGRRSEGWTPNTSGGFGRGASPRWQVSHASSKARTQFRP